MLFSFSQKRNWIKFMLCLPEAVMKRKPIITAIILSIMGCRDEEVLHYKDLNQNMMDIRIYQENLGDHIKAKNMEDADWLLKGMDSIMLILNDRFKEHRKLDAPFSYYYEKEMQEPIMNLREALQKKDREKALQHYRILVDNCNDCHKDLEINKEVNY